MSRKYYFSSKKRKIEDGTKEHPFSSLRRTESLPLEKGDEILLSAGSLFLEDYIHLKNVDGITIAKYGKGKRPVIDACGKGVWFENYGTPLDNPNHVWRGYVSSTILLFDSNDITLEGIEVRNSDSNAASYSLADRMDRTGIAVVAKDRGTISNIAIEDVYVTSVRGNTYNKHLSNGGIYFTALMPEKGNPLIPRFDFVLISSCFVKDTSRWGIALGYTYLWEKFCGTLTDESVFNTYGNTNIRIEDTYVKNIGGDGITVMYSLFPSVIRCRADSVALEMNDLSYKEPGERKGKVAAAIWSWKCFGALFEYNEVYDTKLNQDGMAYDADSGWYTVYRNNYSHSNEGGAVMFCLGEAIGSVYENNVSDDDLGGIFSPSGCPDGSFENNLILRRKSTPLLRRRMSDGKAEYIKNREIIIERER